MIFQLLIKDGRLAFRSEQHKISFQEFLKKNDGKTLRVALSKTPVSDKLRAYYWAAVLPTAQSAVPEWKGESLEDIHEILKKFLNGYDIWNPRTNRVERIGRSAMGAESNTQRAMDYIEKIREWLATEYLIELPTPEEYKAHRDSAPTKE